MSKRAEEAALKVCPPMIVKDEDGSLDDLTYMARTWVQKGYEQAEKDILSKITKEHLDGLKWIERTGITSQPYPYHKYCKELRKTLETLLSDE